MHTPPPSLPLAPPSRPYLTPTALTLQSPPPPPRPSPIHPIHPFIQPIFLIPEHSFPTHTGFWVFGVLLGYLLCFKAHLVGVGWVGGGVMFRAQRIMPGGGIRTGLLGLVLRLALSRVCTAETCKIMYIHLHCQGMRGAGVVSGLTRFYWSGNLTGLGCSCTS